jgi:hypothetical protein
VTAEFSNTARRPHVLVLGRAKTGTTFIAKSIEASCPKSPARFIMEPKTQRDINRAASMATKSTLIVKVLYDHWDKQREALSDFAAGLSQPNFHARIAIVRDPRDEIISRLMFRPFSFLINGDARAEDVERWANVLEQREQNSLMTFLDVQKAFAATFPGTRDPADEIRLIARLCMDYADYLKQNQTVFATLRYEDAVADDFSAIQSALGWQVAKTGDLGRFGHTKRSGAATNWAKWFHPSDLEIIKGLMEPACAALGYHDWALPADIDRTIEPEHHSDYTRGLVRQYHQQGGAARSFIQRLRNRLFA